MTSSQKLKFRLEKIFPEEIKFLKGELNDQFFLNQYRYFFNQLLNLYLNGNDKVRSNKLYIHFNSKLHKESKRIMLILEKIRAKRDKSFESSGLIEDDLISHFQYLFGFVSHSPNKIISRKIKLDYADLREVHEKNHRYFKYLLKLSDEINSDVDELIDAMVLSNSLVTLDYVEGFSDLDAAIYVNTNCFNSKEHLRRLRMKIIRWSKNIYLHDPTQHHSFFIFSPIDLLHYPEAFYPTILNEFSAKIYGCSELQYNLVDDHLEKRIALLRSINRLIMYLEKESNTFNLFDIKDLISQITLFPVIYIQFISNYNYKRDAFNQIDAYFDNHEVFKMAEQLRSTFPFGRLWGWPNFIHPSLINIVYARLKPNYPSNKIKEIKVQLLQMLEEVLTKIERNGRI